LQVGSTNVTDVTVEGGVYVFVVGRVVVMSTTLVTLGRGGGGRSTVIVTTPGCTTVVDF